MKPLKAHELLACLERHHVRYVLIGGLGAVLHGSPIPTIDVDICPARDSENLASLANALRELDARVRTEGVPEGLPFACEAEFLERVQILNLTTSCGDLDVSFTPSGTGGFADLQTRAAVMKLKDSSVPVAALEDIIRSKEAANRPKDQRALPMLRQLLKEIDSRRRQSGGGD